MADDIVSCPSCSKKFRIPEGAADSGTFPCSACGATVSYGAAAAAPAAAGGRRSRRAKAAPAQPAGGGERGRRGAKAKPAAAAGGRRGKGGRGRRARRGEGDELTPEKKDDNTLPIVAAVMGGLLVLGLLVFILAKDDPKPEPVTATPEALDLDTTSGLSSGGGTDGTSTTPAATTPTSTPDTSTPTSTTPDTSTDTTPTAPTKPEEASGVGSTSEDTGGSDEKDYSQWFNTDPSELFIVHEDIAGVDAAERAEIDSQVATAVDFFAGMQGNKAQVAIEEMGKKAIPALLSTFKGQTWESREEQFAAHKVQQMLRTIVKAEEPPSPLVARFMGRELGDPKTFQRAARMWIAWWLGYLRHQESFKEFEE